ncbi:MAG: MBOAT family protein [Candidatus Omnitrophica bacterium]|nr:MBOAT family protein [Candidatus Omnitrophota bacterium]
MLFTSSTFMFCFLPLTLFAFWFFKRKPYRLWILFISSYIFYGSWNWKFLSLLLISTCVDYWAGIVIGKTQKRPIKITALWFSIICNLGILGFFKYYNFFISDFIALGSLFGKNINIPVMNIILPVGISFYTFQSMSYTIDVYRNMVKPTHSFIKFASYVSAFPQLVAGPIIRYKDIHKQFDTIDRPFDKNMFLFGFQLFLLGLFKKVLIADCVAGMINPLFQQYQLLGTFEAWMAILGYTFQIYFDFSGYSDMAIGLGKMLGLRIPINFNSPYKAVNISDFWRRWHISLSTWLRDYVYIPLGGSYGSTGNTLINILIVLTIGGLWHGAAWTFVLWGIYHALLIIGYHVMKKNWDTLPSILQRAGTLFFVIIGWVLFRSRDMAMAQSFFISLFTFSKNHVAASSQLIQLSVLNLLLIISVNVFPNSNAYTANTHLRTALICAILFLLCLFSINAQQIEFLYYQF